MFTLGHFVLPYSFLVYLFLEDLYTRSIRNEPMKSSTAVPSLNGTQCEEPAWIMTLPLIQALDRFLNVLESGFVVFNFTISYVYR